MEQQLFGNRIKPACKYCTLGSPVPREERLLCAKHGLVDAEHSCRRFDYDPLARIPKRPQLLPQYEDEDFAI